MKNLQKNDTIIMTGATGLVGTRVKEILAKEYTVYSFNQDDNIILDIRNEAVVEKRMDEVNPAYLIHMAALTDVDQSEKEKDKGTDSLTWQINVLGTQNLANACRKRSIPILYISTDFVFDGTEPPYTEESQPKPINFYGASKLAGEKIINDLGENAIVCRISFPFRKDFDQKKDIIRNLIDVMAHTGKCIAINDQVITPTYIDEIGEAIATIIQTRSSGIFHVVGSQSLTPYELATVIKQRLNLNSIIEPVTAAEYYRNRAPRPYQNILKNDKIKALGVRLSRVEDVIDIFS